MTSINSVLGPLDTADLGFTLMHEHILVGTAGVYRDYPELLGAAPMKRVVAALTRAKEGGVDTIVDATTLDLKRVVFPQLRDMGVAEATLEGLCVDAPRSFFEGA